MKVFETQNALISGQCFLFLLFILCFRDVAHADGQRYPPLADTSSWVNKDDYRTTATFSPVDITGRKLHPGDIDLVAQNRPKQIQANVMSSRGGFPELPVYVSLTTISSRQEKAFKTILNLMRGSVMPTHIYLMISKDPFLIDAGIPEVAILPQLMSMAIRYPQQFSIVYTDNIGPHRKLLPILARMWNEDVLIITLDDESQTQDHTTTNSLVVESLLTYYHVSKHRDVVALRARRMGVCRAAPHALLSYMFWPVVAPLRREMLLMPTGTGGILYRPKFFHPVVFDRNLREATKLADDLMFRMATLAKNIFVTIGCMSVPRRRRYCPNPDRTRLDEYGASERRPMFKSFNASIHLTREQRLERLQQEADKRNGKKREKKFPTFWGPPPDKQTKDLVTLPAGYGRGSSTLRDWIDMKLADEDGAEDEEDGGRGRRGLRARPTTLYQINARGGNDKAWRNGTEYLSRAGVTSIRATLTASVKPERKFCLEGYWEGLMAADAKYRDAIIPNAVRSCALKKCKSESMVVEEEDA